MESKKINQLATELAPDLSDITIIGDPTTGISKKITLSQMASLFTGTVEEYANLAAFPLVGVADTIYIALDTNILYRWNTGTSAYVELSPNIVSSLVFNDANGFDGTINLVGSVATLTITTALTTGSVGFIGASGALLQDNANFFWDDTNNRLGLGTNAPTTALDVFGSGIIGRINGTSTNNAFLGFASAGTNKWSIGNVQSDHRFRIYNEATTSELVSVLSTGEFGIGIANPTTKFHIDGAASALIANLDANVSVAKSISFRSDNSNRINLEVSGTESGSNAGADFFIRRYSDLGALIDTPLTIVRSTGYSLFTGRIGIGTITPSTLLHISTARTNGTNVNVLTLSDTTTGAQTVGFGTRIQYFSNGTSVEAAIGLEQGGTGTNNESQISFYTQNTAGALSKQLTIGSTGAAIFSSSVGLGGVSPTRILHLSASGSNCGIRVDNTVSGRPFLMLYDDSQNLTLINSSDSGYFAYVNGTGSGTERLRITSSGVVGIGTSSPSTTFNGLDISSGGLSLIIGADNGASTRTNATQKVARFSSYNYTNANASVGMMVANNDGTDNLLLLGGGSGSLTASTQIQFYTAANNNTISGTERMRITSTGRVGINQGSPGVQLSVGGQSDAWQFGVTTVQGTAGALIGSPSANVLAFGDWSGTERMRITSAGQIVMGRTTGSGGRLTVDGDVYLHNISAGAGTSTLKYNHTSTGLVTYDTSSRLLKKDIEDLKYGIEDILKMSAKIYKWKKDDSIDLGFIADEMFEIIPEIVFFSNENTEQSTGVPSGQPLSINYDRLIPILVKGIQELKAQIDELKNK